MKLKHPSLFSLRPYERYRQLRRRPSTSPDSPSPHAFFSGSRWGRSSALLCTANARTHIYNHTHVRTPSLTLSHSHVLSLSSHTYSLPLSHSHSLSLSLSLSHTYVRSLSPSLSLFLTHTRSNGIQLPTISLSLSHSLFPPPSLSLSFIAFLLLVFFQSKSLLFWQHHSVSEFWISQTSKKCFLRLSLFCRLQSH